MGLAALGISRTILPREGACRERSRSQGGCFQRTKALAYEAFTAEVTLQRTAWNRSNASNIRWQLAASTARSGAARNDSAVG